MFVVILRPSFFGTCGGKVELRPSSFGARPEGKRRFRIKRAASPRIRTIPTHRQETEHLACESESAPRLAAPPPPFPRCFLPLHHVGVCFACWWFFKGGGEKVVGKRWWGKGGGKKVVGKRWWEKESAPKHEQQPWNQTFGYRADDEKTQQYWRPNDETVTR